MTNIDKKIDKLNEGGFLVQQIHQRHFTLFEVALRHVDSWKLFNGAGKTVDEALDKAATVGRELMARPKPVKARKQRVRLASRPKKAKRRVRL